jgi:hypothetical protein
VNVADVRKLKHPLDRLMYWVRERESVRRKKELGLPRPWTDDEILGTYRFTNVRRMDDKVSKWLLTNWYRPYRDHANMVSAVALARLINNPDVLSFLEPWVFLDGGPNWRGVETTAKTMRNEGRTIFNAAYMVRGGRKGGDKVHEVVYDYVRPIADLPDGGNELVHPVSMEETWKAVRSRYGFGSFMAGQVVADLRHALSGSWRDKRVWAPRGPGSMRGLNRLHGRDPKTPVDAARWADEFGALLEVFAQELPPDLTKRLEAMDYQNCLCEF